MDSLAITNIIVLGDN